MPVGATKFAKRVRAAEPVLSNASVCHGSRVDRSRQISLRTRFRPLFRRCEIAPGVNHAIPVVFRASSTGTGPYANMGYEAPTAIINAPSSGPTGR